MTPATLRATPEYHAVAKAVSDLLNARPCQVDDLRWAWRTAPAGDYCDDCSLRDDVDDPTCWPIKLMPDGRYAYRCHRCGHAWATGWAAFMLNGETSSG